MRKIIATAALSTVLLGASVGLAVAQDDPTTTTTTVEQEDDSDMSWLGLLGLLGLAGLMPRKRNDHTTTTVRH